MRTVKSVLGIIGALIPILYCGGLIYYFTDTSGSVQEAKDIGLGPTLLGLAIVGGLFCIPLLFKIVRLFARPRTPGSGGQSGPSGAPDDGDGGAKADATIARYMAAQRAQAIAPARPPQRTAPKPTQNSGFGRKTN